MNVDASFHHETFSGSTGVVIRDSYGVFIAAACSLLPHVPDAYTAEILAMKQCLMLANEMGLHSIQIESDSVEVINACSGQDRIWNEASAIYADCFILAGMIVSVQFSHCFREANVGQRMFFIRM